MKCEHEELVCQVHPNDIECKSCGLNTIDVHDELRKVIDRLRKRNSQLADENTGWRVYVKDSGDDELFRNYRRFEKEWKEEGRTVRLAKAKGITFAEAKTMIQCEHEWESVLYNAQEDWASPYESVCKHCGILEEEQ